MGTSRASASRASASRASRASAEAAHEIAPGAWVPPDRAAFPRWVAETFAYGDGGGGGGGGDGGAGAGAELYVQQRFVRDYLQHDSPYRGLLLFHGLGSGKTASAVAASEALRARGRRVFVLLPASLEPNYVKEVKRFGGAAYSEQRAWRFEPGAEAAGARRRLGGAWVADDGERGTPFERLSPEQRDQVSAQVAGAVRATHRFVRYNGLGAHRLDEMLREPGLFDGAVVVIDEVHNFVSAVISQGLAARLYDAIMGAPGCKVVMLSGTPLINSPLELAYLVNLAHGFVDVQDVAMRPGVPPPPAAALDASPHVLEHRVDVAAGGRSVLTCRMAPDGFVRAADPPYALVRAPPGAPRTSSDALAALLPPGGVLSRTLRRVLLLPIDARAFEDAFVDAATNRLKNVEVLLRRTLGTVSYFRGHDPSLYPRASPPHIVRVPMSARQFNEYALRRFEERRREQQAARRAARAARAGRGGGAAGGEGSQQLYRAFSRQVCNFVFPEGVPRPYRADVRKAVALDAPDEGHAGAHGDAVAGDVTRRYLAELDAAVARLRAEPGRLALAPGVAPPATRTRAGAGAEPRGGEGEGGEAEADPGSGSAWSAAQRRAAQRRPESGLDELSPKYAEVARRLLRDERRGTALVYSEFRRAEGIGLLAAALEANGFSELRVQRGAAGELEVAGGAPPRFAVYSNEDPEAADAVRAIFNGQLDRVPAGVAAGLARLPGAGGRRPRGNLRGELVRALMITKSGAEGIDLKNVREVHVLEPFWHAVRVRQVIGRAVRAGSHAALPPAERTVDTYVYLATLTPDQRKQDPSIARLDRGITSDEYVHEVAVRKWRLVAEALDVMARAAVDCELHARRHAGAHACFRAPAGAPPGAALYAPDGLDLGVAPPGVAPPGVAPPTTPQAPVARIDGRGGPAPARPSPAGPMAKP